MGAIKPVYNNFSAGEITPKLYGRMDSPIYQAGVNRLENFTPDMFGSVRRRGGLKHLATATGVERIIPWSISDELDILILMSDASLKFYAVWQDSSDNGFIEHDSTVIDITTIGSGVDAPAVYATADIPSVKYAQGIRTIYLAHPGYPLFFVKFKGYDDGDYTIEHGRVGFSGNWAYTPEPDDAALLNTDPISTENFVSMMSRVKDGYTTGAVYLLATDNTPTLVATRIKLAATGFLPSWVVTSATDVVTFEADAVGARAGTYSFQDLDTTGITGTWAQVTAGDATHKEKRTLTITGATLAAGHIGFTLSSLTVFSNPISGEINTKQVIGIKKTKTTVPWKIQVNIRDWADSLGANGDFYADDNVPVAGLDLGVNTLKMTDQSGVMFKSITFYGGVGAGFAANDVKAAIVARNIEIASVQVTGFVFDLTGTITYVREQSTYAYTVLYIDGTTLAVSSSTTGLTGYISIPGLGISINKNNELGSIVMDNIAAWMTPGIQYPCDGDTAFSGIASPSWAMKVEGGDVLLDGDEVIEAEAEPYILVAGSGSERVKITTTSPAFTGRLGVDLNPFNRGRSNPGFVCFHQNRLVLGGSLGEPNVLYLSKTNEFTNFQVFEEIEYERTELKPKDDWTNPDVPEWNVYADTVQQVNVDSAFVMRIMTDENEAIKWGVSVSDLVLGTNTSEWVVPADVTANSARITLTSRNGSNDVQGRFIGNGVIFVSRTGYEIKSFNAAIGQMGDSMSAQAEHIIKEFSGVKSMDFRQDPQSELFVALNGNATAGYNTAAVATLSPEVMGFWRLTTRSGDKIISLATINEATEDGVYFIVDRTNYAGTTVRYLERLQTTDDDAFLTRLYLDNFETGTTSGAGAITAAVRFYNQHSFTDIFKRPFIVFSTGVYGYPVIAADGSSSTYIPYDADPETPVANPASTTYIIGYRYESTLKLNRLDSMEMEGLPKQGGAVNLRLYKSGDVFMVREYDDTQRVQVYVPNDSTGVRIYPYTGSVRFENIAPASVDQNFELLVDTHESCTIQAIALMYTVGESI